MIGVGPTYEGKYAKKVKPSLDDLKKEFKETPSEKNNGLPKRSAERKK